MAEQAITEDIGEDVEVEAKPRGRGLAGKKLVLIVVAPLFLLIAGGAGAYFAGLLDPILGGGQAEGEAAVEEEVPQATIFYDLPEMLVNLNSASRGASYLKISVSLEISSDADRKRIEELMPRIVDNFQVYLRELRIEDLSGSAGLQRLREELLLRVNAAVQPSVVRDVLFKEMLVQ